MDCAADAQHSIVDCLVPVRVHAYRFRHDGFNFLRHDAELAAMAPLVTKCSLVIEQVEADAQWMVADFDDIFLDALVSCTSLSVCSIIKA